MLAVERKYSSIQMSPIYKPPFDDFGWLSFGEMDC